MPVLSFFRPEGKKTIEKIVVLETFCIFATIKEIIDVMNRSLLLHRAIVFLLHRQEG